MVQMWPLSDHVSIESFSCYEKSLEFDEYDGQPKFAQDQGFTCVTQLSQFQKNMLSQSVPEIDVLQYV